MSCRLYHRTLWLRDIGDVPVFLGGRRRSVQTNWQDELVLMTRFWVQMLLERQVTSISSLIPVKTKHHQILSDPRSLLFHDIQVCDLFLCLYQCYAYFDLQFAVMSSGTVRRITCVRFIGSYQPLLSLVLPPCLSLREFLEAVDCLPPAQACLSRKRYERIVLLLPPRPLSKVSVGSVKSELRDELLNFLLSCRHGSCFTFRIDEHAGVASDTRYSSQRGPHRWVILASSGDSGSGRWRVDPRGCRCVSLFVVSSSQFIPIFILRVARAVIHEIMHLMIHQVCDPF